MLQRCSDAPCGSRQLRLSTVRQLAQRGPLLMTGMGKMPDDVLVLAHDEILRLRERQVGRISSIRGRAAGVLGASGLLAPLVTVLSSNAGYTLSIIGFVFATIYAVKSMTVKGTPVMHPVGVLNSVVGKDAFEARVELTKQLRNEYDRAEENLREVVRHTRTDAPGGPDFSSSKKKTDKYGGRVCVRTHAPARVRGIACKATVAPGPARSIAFAPVKPGVRSPQHRASEERCEVLPEAIAALTLLYAIGRSPGRRMSGAAACVGRHRLSANVPRKSWKVRRHGQEIRAGGRPDPSLGMAAGPATACVRHRLRMATMMPECLLGGDDTIVES